MNIIVVFYSEILNTNPNTCKLKKYIPFETNISEKMWIFLKRKIHPLFQMICEINRVETCQKSML